MSGPASDPKSYGKSTVSAFEPGKILRPSSSHTLEPHFHQDLLAQVHAAPAHRRKKLVMSPGMSLEDFGWV